jgi:8-oxo-dGDP phosphatase
VTDWTIHGEQALYDSPWVRLGLADVETPSGTRHSYHLVRMPVAGAGTVIVDEASQILLIHRYRFITGTWGWELPAGRVDPGETPDSAAAREATEETGWKPTALQHLVSLHTSPGLTDQTSHVFLSRNAIYQGPPADPDEASDVHWTKPADVRRLLHLGEIHDSFTMCGLLWYLSFGDSTDC